MNELISIIVPVYNVVNYLPYTLDCILSQTYSNWELLLVDDGSTDNSSSICDEYASKDDRIRVFHIPNGGVSNARNIGLSNSKGNYIVFCDSDDLMDNNTLSILYDLQQKTQSDIVSCSYSIIDEDERVYKASQVSLNEQILNNNSFINLQSNYWGIVWGKLIKKELIIKNNFCFAKDMYLSEDTLFCELCTINANSVVINTSNLIGYRQRTGSITKSGKSFFYQAIKRYRYLESLPKEIILNENVYYMRKDKAFLDLLMWLYTPRKKYDIIKNEVKYLYSQEDLLKGLRSLELKRYTKQQQVFLFLLTYLGKHISPCFIYIQQRICRI